MTFLRFLPATLLSLSVLAAPASAQDQTLTEAARSYISSPGQQAVIDRLLSPDSVVEQIRQASPELSSEVATQIGEIASEELSDVREPLEEAMVTAAAETFTLKEITALDEFYRTPEGEAILTKMQPFMQSAMTLVAPTLQSAQEKIMQRSFEVMQDAQ